MTDSSKNACATIEGHPAVGVVGDAYTKLMGLGLRTYDLAIDNLNKLGSIPMEDYQFALNFGMQAPLPNYNLPVPPNLDTSGLTLRDPTFSLGSAPMYQPGNIVFDPPPVYNEEAPTLTFGVKPDAPDIQLPLAPGQMEELTIPLPPDYKLPDVPTFDMLRIPDLPVMSIPEFNLTAPTFIEPPFNQTWDFDPKPYTSGLRDMLVNALTPIIQGQEALPPPMEAMIFERMRDRIDKETGRNVEQAYAEYSARGFDTPSGILQAMVAEVRRAGADQIADASRETSIEQYKQTLELFKFSVVQGAALEGQLSALHIEETRFAMEGAKLQMETQQLILKARIDVFNARLEAYRTEAQVFRDRLQVELSKIEIFKAQLDGARLRGELNMQRVQLYNAMIEGVKAKADFYRGQLEGVRIKADIQKGHIERYKTEVEAYSERWRANVAEWQGYTASVDAESKRVDVFKALVEANGVRLSSWAKQQDSKIELEKLSMAHHDQRLKVWATGVDRLKTHYDAERTRLDAVAQSNTAKARMFEAEAKVAETQSEAEGRIFEHGMRREQARVDLQVKEIDLKINLMQKRISDLASIRQTMAQVSSQLAASTISAFNVGATISDGMSYSKSCSTSFSYSGEIIDAG